jgi:hypothetical protein
MSASIGMELLMTDSELLDWLEETNHVLCKQGDWFCAWRGPTDEFWLDRPTAETARGAIEVAAAHAHDYGYGQPWDRE